MVNSLSEPIDEDLSAWLAGDSVPDWAADEAALDECYAAEPVGARLAELLSASPADRPTAALALLDARKLSLAGQVDLLELLHEQSNWLAAATTRVLAAIDDGDNSQVRLSQDAVSLVLKMSGRAAQRQLKAARTLVDQLPATMSLLESGRITTRHAELISESSSKLPPDLLPELEARVAGRAAEQTPGQLKQSLARALLTLDPATAQQRHERATAERKVGFQPADDGMVELPVLVPAPQGQLIYTRLTAAATMLPASDVRTMDQRRADLLVDEVLAGLPVDSLPKVQGHRPAIQVVVGADTLLNLDDQPAELVGYGPITADTARRLAADESGTWRRLLTDPDTGQLLDISPDRYRPSRRLKDFVVARDGTCVFPTCNQPGYRCHYDHITPFDKGGKTCRCNGALACRRHNNCKINTGWSYRANEDGSYTWTTDTGHSYVSHPPEWLRPRWATDEQPP
ncbi:MAG: DUF222 domain-containing protein [Jatrophihabitantaceae bacterium]